MADSDVALSRLEAVAAALTAVGDATRAANTETLAACEPVLAASLASMPSAEQLSGIDPQLVLASARRIADALERCRALGGAATELIAASLAAQGMAHGYLPPGVAPPAPRLGRLEVRA